jgi:hypothetical protein
MITVTYKKRCSPITNGQAVYYIKDITGTGERMRLLIPDCERGRILLNGTAYRIKDGVCEMPTPASAIDITLIANERQIATEAFAVCPEGVTRAEASAEAHAALREACFMLEDALALQNDRIRVLEDKISGTPLFKFK